MINPDSTPTPEENQVTTSQEAANTTPEGSKEKPPEQVATEGQEEYLNSLSTPISDLGKREYWIARQYI